MSSKISASVSRSASSQVSSLRSSTSATSISQRSSSQAMSSVSSVHNSASPSSRVSLAASLSSVIPRSSSDHSSTFPPPSQSLSVHLSVPPSPSASTQPASATAQVTSSSHRPAVIAAVISSVVGAFILGFLALFIVIRRRRNPQLSSINSQGQYIFREPSSGDNEKEWNLDSAHSTDESPWSRTPGARPQTGDSANSLPPGTVKAPHYSVRARTGSVGSAYGFGQDIAWQEAHYENPLPTPRPPPAPQIATINVIPPTPATSIHQMPATSLLRSPSTSSSVESAYSRASMALPPDIALPPGTDSDVMPTSPGHGIIHDHAFLGGEDSDRHWLSHDPPPESGSQPEYRQRRLI